VLDRVLDLNLAQDPAEGIAAGHLAQNSPEFAIGFAGQLIP
jgi:hypothetical protein